MRKASHQTRRATRMDRIFPKQKLFFCFIFLLPLCASAQERNTDIQVQATALEEFLPERTDPQVSKIKKNKIESAPLENPAEALRSEKGIVILQSGGPGQPISFFNRGMRSEDTLVLLDGVPLGDPLSPAGAYDFSHLDLTQIEEIEVLRGPQSVRYGAGASGGVISITSQRPKFNPSASLRGEAGSYQTGGLNGQFSTRQNTFGLVGGARFFRTQGFSAADASQGNPETDGASAYSASLLSSYVPSSETEIEAQLRSENSETELDQHGGVGGDDPNFRSWFAQNLVRNALTTHWWQRQIVAKYSVSYLESRRWDLDPVSLPGSNFQQDQFISETLNIKTEHQFNFSYDQSISLFVEEENISAESLSQQITSSLSLSSNIPRTTFNQTGEGLLYERRNSQQEMSLGVRNDQSPTLNPWTMQASYGFALEPKLWLRGDFASGVKIPSLYELYSNYGNSSLLPEQSQSVEFSVDKGWAEDDSVSLAAYQIRGLNWIDFSSATQKYANISSVQIWGVELGGRHAFSPRWSADLNITYLDPRDLSTGQLLLRRPVLSGAGHLLWNFASQGDLSLACRYLGSREDTDPVSLQRIPMGGVFIYSAHASYKWNESEVSLRLENLLNTQYQEVAGFGTAGISGYLDWRQELE